jgi:UDP-glucose 4-epimerase
MSILVTGGAGYIGSHTVRALREAGEEVLVLDDLSEGNRASIPSDVRVYEVDLKDANATREALVDAKPEAVFHFAASCYVGESVTDPAIYYRQNFVATMNLLDAMRAAESKRFVLSSTCAVYGEPGDDPDRRRAAEGADQPLRAHQALLRGPARGLSPCLRDPVGQSALLQCCGRPS